ncbi:MAG: molybdopterin-synthase adenylyltransferase MoeB [Pseudotabrizicola sp.]|uniref:HesA/MoeB/ThiF family protein n=1 Tax=Pseudotabrizicola sp. TaxID=2939647 RepID=UPI00271BC853|nr:molybdopterin-synthase adenylyltransferase MoeB [Pseudotabrizicola sp.]MDO8882002.1 molybdopterin-synthase adenylyltransferase MoeB [Pseudotabrizicola sp.]MDP2079573.1 molybdopterin-synthase adenylyltransferase MoeB [Pseudotabrizicola sp.]MDZ7572405.1 molybdopterin-synthase adenylyltransferase MoeB [Pseudotabrizicola sp.]
MIGILGFVAVFGLGRWLGWAARWVWLLAWGWLLVLLLAHAPYMPPELGAFVGGEFRGWFVLGVLVAMALAYRKVLARVRKQVAPVVEAQKPGVFSPVELDRYARHIMLREIGGSGQKSLKTARVLVVGAGGLGSPALMYLAASGVGVIGVIDGDVVEGSNLQRQIIHADARIGMPKVFSAELAMKALNPFIDVRPYHRRMDAGLAAELVADYDLVLDGTDNFDTRYLVNRICAAAGKPLISAAITQWEGQISLYDPARGGPCFECVFPLRPAPGLVPSCAEAGVAAPLPGIIGAMMAMEAVKHLVDAGTGLRGRLMIHDALYAETRVIGVKRREGCAACGGLHG